MTTKQFAVSLLLMAAMALAILILAVCHWRGTTSTEPTTAPPEPESTYTVIRATVEPVKPMREPMRVEAVLDVAEPEAVEPDPYTPAEADVLAIARTLYGEARGVASKAQQAAVAWVILSRLDAGYADTVEGVCAAPGQFYGYNASHPVTDELRELAIDVLTRHHREQQGETDVGRVIPAEYLWFSGDGAGRNRFRNAFTGGEYWDWSLEDVYGEDKHD